MKNSSKKTIILVAFTLVFLVLILQLAGLQLFSGKYKILANQQGILRKVIYPDRGLIVDDKGKPLLQNIPVSDLMVTPNRLKGIDTVLLCDILGIDTAHFRKKIVDAILKNGSSRPSVFQSMLTPEQTAKINESLYRLVPAFYLQDRSIRFYPEHTAANLLGYIAEVDSTFLKKYASEGYAAGDYAGMTGLERSYEKVLMGERGIEYWKKDNKNRLTERWENGRYDTLPEAGRNLYTSVNLKLQQLGEKLMENKLGAIVALNPKTGSVLAMVSAPTYDPNSLIGSSRRKNFSELFLNPALPLLNRTVSATYSPGSTFKTLQALVGLNEGVITTDFTVTCHGAFYGCGSAHPMRCLDYGTFNLRSAITVSDNTYFATVMQKVINNPKYPNIDSSLSSWDRYMYHFGLGHKLGVDVPSEKAGLIPTYQYYDKKFGKDAWNFCTFKSVSIGQGEVDNTPLQVANEMAFIANKGWYYTPHVVDSIEGGDVDGVLDKFKVKNEALEIADSIYEAVHDGMQGVVERGTGKGARVKGVTICGKTGTVENYYRGVKQPNHGFFCAFAPRENPKIAIMCVVENGGRFGGTYAAPIVGLMIEQYLNDSITDKGRLTQIERLSNTNLIPARIYKEMKRQDSLAHASDTAYLVAKGYITLVEDTLQLEDFDEKTELQDVKHLNESQKNTPSKSKDTAANFSIEGTLPNRNNKAIIDSAKKLSN